MIVLRILGACFLLMLAWLVAAIVRAVRPLPDPQGGKSEKGQLSEKELESLLRRYP